VDNFDDYLIKFKKKEDYQSSIGKYDIVPYLIDDLVTIKIDKLILILEKIIL
jgi:hypothetical protein